MKKVALTLSMLLLPCLAFADVQPTALETETAEKPFSQQTPVDSEVFFDDDTLPASSTPATDFVSADSRAQPSFLGWECIVDCINEQLVCAANCPPGDVVCAQECVQEGNACKASCRGQ